MGLQQWLKEQNMDLYIDWQDASMLLPRPASVT